MLRQRWYYFIFGLILLTIIILGFKPAVLFFTQRALKKQLSADTLSIQEVRLKSLNEIYFLDISAEKNGVYFLKVHQVKLALRLKENISAQFSRRIFLPQVECADLQINFHLKDLKLSGRVSFNADLFDQKINSLYLDVSTFDYKALHLENLLLWAAKGNERGNLTLEKFKYNKVNITELQSLARIENKDLLFDNLSANFLNGNIHGSFVVRPDILPQYQANLQFAAVDLSRFVDEFELANKFTITGKLSGNVILKGQGAVVKVLSGDLFADTFGGRLMIKDMSFLNHIAFRASLDAVVESLQDYYYNTGSVKLSLDDGDLLADIHLDGKQGKRDFNIILHH